MKKVVAVILVSVCSMMLGGCQTISSAISPGGFTASSEMTDVDMSDYFLARLHAGRQHIRRGRLAQAVTAFRQASYDPARAGEAFNGMGVAYAQLGRADLARLHFRLAINAEPENARYQRNVARLELTARGTANTYSAMRSQPLGSTRPEPAPTAGGSDGGRPLTATVEAVEPLLVRTSRLEVRLLSRLGTNGIAGAKPLRELHLRSTGDGLERHVSGKAVAAVSMRSRVGAERDQPFRLAARERRR